MSFDDIAHVLTVHMTDDWQKGLLRSADALSAFAEISTLNPKHII